MHFFTNVRLCYKMFLTQKFKSLKVENRDFFILVLEDDFFNYFTKSRFSSNFIDNESTSHNKLIKNLSKK